MERMAEQPYVEMFRQLEGSSAVRGEKGRDVVPVNIFLDSRSDVTAIFEAVESRLQGQVPWNQVIRPFLEVLES